MILLLLLVFGFHIFLSHVFLELFNWMVKNDYFEYFVRFSPYRKHILKKIFGRLFIISLFFPIHIFLISGLILMYAWVETEDIRDVQTLYDIKDWFLKYWSGDWKV